MTKLVLPVVLSFVLGSAGAEEPTSGPTEPAIEELSRLLLQQKEIIEAQAREIDLATGISLPRPSRAS